MSLHSGALTFCAERESRVKTGHLLLLVVVANMILMWLYNEFILTREAYHALLTEQMEQNRIDQYFDFLRRASLWSYIAMPVLLLLNFTCVALLIQMPLLLVFIEVPFKNIFRLVTWASLFMVLSEFARFFWTLSLEVSELSTNKLNMRPFSINQFLDEARYPELAYAILGRFNIFEILWCLLIYKGLVLTEKVKKEFASLLVFCLWVILLLFQWGVSAYFQQIKQ